MVWGITIFSIIAYYLSPGEAIEFWILSTSWFLTMSYYIYWLYKKKYKPLYEGYVEIDRKSAIKMILLLYGLLTSFLFWGFSWFSISFMDNVMNTIFISIISALSIGGIFFVFGTMKVWHLFRK